MPNMPSDYWLAFLNASTFTWGGLDNSVFLPVEETPKGSISESILHIFDPDVILTPVNQLDWGTMVSHLCSPFKTIETFPHRTSPWFGTESTTLSDVIDFEANNLDPPEPSGYGADLLHIKRSVPVNATPLMTVMLGRQLGYLDDTNWNEYAKGRFRIMSHIDNYDFSDTDQYETIAKLLIEPKQCHGYENSLAFWNCINLEIVNQVDQINGRDGNADALILVAGRSNNDIALWMNLLALYKHRRVFLLPIPFIAEEEGFFSYYSQALQSFLQEKMTNEHVSCTVLTTSLSETTLQASIQIPFQTLPPDDYGRAIRGCSYWRIPDTLRKRRIHFTLGESNELIHWSYPTWLEEATLRGIRVLGEIEIPHLALPATNALNDKVSDNKPNRVGRHGIVCEPLRSRLFQGSPIEHDFKETSLFLPGLLAGIQNVVQIDKGKVDLSSSGRMLLQVAAKAGSRATLYEAISSDSWKTFRQLAKFDNQKKPELTITLNSRRYAFGYSFFTENGVSKNDISNWTTMGLINWGIVVDCSICHLTDWYPWDLITNQGASCYRCQSKNSVGPHAMYPIEPRAVLDELVNQSLVQNCGMEEIALAEFLQKDFGISTEVGIEWYESEDKVGQTAEADIIGLAFGDIFVGEAKSNGQLNADDLKKMVQMAIALNARTLVFGTSLESWPKDSLTRIEKLAKQDSTFHIWTCDNLGTKPKRTIIS